MQKNLRQIYLSWKGGFLKPKTWTQKWVRLWELYKANQSFGIMTFLLAACTLLTLVGFGVSAIKQNPKKVIGGTQNQVLGQVVEATETAKVKPLSPTPTIRIKAQAGMVAYTPAKIIESSNQLFDISLLETGTINDGVYATKQLLLLTITGPFSPSCLGKYCHQSQFARFVKTDVGLNYLPLNSRIPKYLDEALRRGVSVNEDKDRRVFEENVLAILKKLGRISVNEDLVITELSYPSELNERGAKLALATFPESLSQIDPELVMPIFNHPQLGLVHTTRLDKQQLANDTWKEFTPWRKKNTGAACEGKACLLTNAFFVFRPDGTMLRYDYVPYLDPFEIDLSSDVLLTGEYEASTRIGCDDSLPRLLTIVDEKILADPKMKKIGSWPTSEQPVFAITDQNHKHYQELFDQFVANQPSLLYGETLLGLRFDEFVRSLPVLYWKDPFGRLIQFTNTDFATPLACGMKTTIETDKDQVLTLTLDKQVSFLTSIPDHAAGWSVVAKPSGKLTQLNLINTVDELRWEGKFPALARPKVGYVVRREELSRFFEDKLKIYGLNDKQRVEFVKEWLPQLTTAHYFMIGIYPREMIDVYAPFNVEPKPDLITRLLLDIRPLKTEIPAIEPIEPISELKKEGVRVVEWGVVKR